MNALGFWRSLGRMAALILFGTVCCTGPGGLAQSSLFDPEFLFSAAIDGSVFAIAIQNDGCIIVGGDRVIAGQSNSGLVRLYADGRLDPSFGCGTDDSVVRLLQQPDGRILVGGGFRQLHGVDRPRLGRLLANGAVDPDFTPGDFLATNGTIFSLAVQTDGKVLVGTTTDGANGRLYRLTAHGQLDEAFVQTNIFNGFAVYSLYACMNGTILVGGGFNGVNGVPSPGLALLDSSGQHSTNVLFHLENLTTVFAIVERPEGGFWIAGRLLQQDGATTTNVLARLTPAFEWDTQFSTDRFELPSEGSYVTSLVVQPDGKLVLGGNFYVVGGYWRRHIVRLNPQGHVDPCFDPGLGLGDTYGAYIVVRQADGRVLVGGHFYGLPGGQSHLARLLPQSDCNAMRTYLLAGYSYFNVLATCPPGGTNILQCSSNLVDWLDVVSDTRPYIFWLVDYSKQPASFFRVKKLY